jgi:hypothetical protein
MAVIYKVSAITGKYKDSNGEDKNRYADLGVVMDTKNGPMLKLESIPLNWDGWAYLNTPQPKDGDKKQQRKSEDDDSDAIPF